MAVAGLTKKLLSAIAHFDITNDDKCQLLILGLVAAFLTSTRPILHFTSH